MPENQTITSYEEWNEELIMERSLSLFSYACQIWMQPNRKDGTNNSNLNSNSINEQNTRMSADGICRFTYFNKTYDGRVIDGTLYVEGLEEVFNSLSAASVAISGTHRNGWNDWYFSDNQGGWILANVMRES